jgi:hypothetical protein
MKAGDTFYFDENADGKAEYSITNPDFNFHEFRSNFVLRWEYRAASTFYFVWGQDRTAYEQVGPFSFNKGYDRMFGLFPKNIFMVKFNYWFSM